MSKKNYFYFYYSAKTKQINSIFQKKYSKNVAYLSSSAGQAIVEYVLILSVLVFVGGGLLFTFNQGVQAWGKALLGTDGYFACLLQTGLLPMQSRPGVDCGHQLVNANKAFKDMNLTLTGGEGGGSNPTNPGNKNNPNSNQSPNNQSSSTNENGNRYPTRSSTSTPSKSSGKSSSTYQPSGQLFAANNQLNSLDDPDSNITYTKRKRRKKTIKLKIKKKQSGFKGYQSENTEKRYEQLYSTGYLTEEEEQEQRARKIAVAGSTKKNNLLSHKKKPMRLIKKLKTKNQKGPEVGNWSFGNIFRFVMIIGILAIIAFLIANQANSVRKSLK